MLAVKHNPRHLPCGGDRSLRRCRAGRLRAGGPGRCLRSGARDLPQWTRPTGPLTHRYRCHHYVPTSLRTMPVSLPSLLVDADLVPLYRFYRFGSTSIVRGVPYRVAVPYRTAVSAAPSCQRRAPLTQPHRFSNLQVQYNIQVAAAAEPVPQGGHCQQAAGGRLEQEPPVPANQPQGQPRLGAIALPARERLQT